ncbi:cysteine--tRNA ligase, partial [Candidatus Woesearchaeota archaeon]|nr:cysteine--tRNA ligase [Candidatus Woesearchaeota archaeon]
MLKLYNTLKKKKQPFKPLKKGKVGMYICGPTIYNYVHIGNLRAYVFADILRRYLKFKKYKIKQVMNLTDVDDKTIRDSQKA